MSIDIDAIRARAEAATPGPWFWAGNTKMHDYSISTWQDGLGRCLVMDFVRSGMHGAKPRFSEEDFRRMADPAVRYVVCPDASGPDDPRVYRHDFSGIDHPDAEFIVHAREDVPALLAEIERLQRELDERSTK